MENIIPFIKEIEFNNKISEITSISLEEKYTSTKDTIDGEFIITGDYKIHELSINKEPFEYKLPFSVDLTENINPDTLKLEITDFSYDILNDNILKINIEFKVDAEKEEKIEEENPIEIIEEERVEQPTEIKELEEENTIIDSINEKDTEFTTYHVHTIKESETIESICALYNTNTNILAECNDLTEFKVGNKLLVVESNE